jgi:triosephosphate isomerase
MARPQIASGNWKMNLLSQPAHDLATAIAAVDVPTDVTVIMGVPSIHIVGAVAAVADNPRVHVAAQNCHQAVSGAYTGELSAEMCKDAGCDYVILGHSERRQYFDEGDALLAAKTDTALAAGLNVIFCVGEPLAIRQAGTHVEHVSAQIEAGLFHLTAEQMADIVIAYEPIWAIGTGETASPAQAQDMHKALRALLASKYGDTVADNVAILYGGSVKPANAQEIFSQPDVDGGLVGGASLKADSFEAIIKSF